MLKNFKVKKYDPIYEIRISGNKVEYRPLGFYGPDEKDFTLVIGSTKRGEKRENPVGNHMMHEKQPKEDMN